MSGVSSLGGVRAASVADDSERASPSSTQERPSNPTGMNVPLLVTPYGTISWDAKRSLLRFVRSELGYATIADIEHEGTEVERVLEKAGRGRLLVDLRTVPPRNDPSFELAIARFRRKLFAGGRPAAILVRTAAGALQVMRHMREDGLDVKVFTQEAEALAFLDTCRSWRSQHAYYPARPAPLSRTVRRGTFRRAGGPARAKGVVLQT
jgi:hypothetical protein